MGYINYRVEGRAAGVNAVVPVPTSSDFADVVLCLIDCGLVPTDDSNVAVTRPTSDFILIHNIKTGKVIHTLTKMEG